MDVINMTGGSVSSLVDIGGQTFHEQITYIFDMFGMDSTTEVILLNCFGGMQDTLKISTLLVDAVSRDLVNGKPVVVRMAGTSSVQAIEYLKEYNSKQDGKSVIHIVETFDEACELAVLLSRE